MAAIAVVYHSGSGHTKLMAEAVRRGAASVPGVEVQIHAVTGSDIREGRWSNDAILEALDACDAIVFGCPTYMGGVSAQMKAFLDALCLDYDWYQVQGTNYSCNYNGIGRREDRPLQQPRPPVGGATTAQLDPYEIIWYYAGYYDNYTLDDELTDPGNGGWPCISMQKLEGWLNGSATPPVEDRRAIPPTRQSTLVVGKPKGINGALTTRSTASTVRSGRTCTGMRRSRMTTWRR